MMVGRPTKYREDMPRQAYELCREAGLTERQLARVFQVTKRTIVNWKAAHPEFAEALQKGKDEYDTQQVETATLKAAKGFTYTEIHEEQNGEGNVVSAKKTVKYAPPNPRLNIFWLKNRHPGRWRDKVEVEETVKGELEARIEKARKRTKKNRKETTDAED
ncbi:MAG: hypothetical protein V1742_08680 [Pseudomonadota bacterium]